MHCSACSVDSRKHAAPILSQHHLTGHVFSDDSGNFGSTPDCYRDRGSIGGPESGDRSGRADLVWAPDFMEVAADRSKKK